MFWGYFFAILSAIFLSLYIIPKKFTKQPPFIYNFFIGVGYFITSVIFVVILSIFNKLNEPIFSIYVLFSILDGVLWVLASACFLNCIDTLGLTRASTFKNLQGPISALLFLFVLNEYKNINILFIFFALILIFLSQILFNFNENKQSRLNTKGILFGLLASVFFSLNALVRKITAIHNIIYIGNIYASFTIVVISFIILIIKNKVNKNLIEFKTNKYGLLSGVFYFFASTLMVVSFKFISGAITSSLTKLSGLITVFIGIVFFKEINFKKHYIRIVLGAFCIILAVVVLFFA